MIPVSAEGFVIFTGPSVFCEGYRNFYISYNETGRLGDCVVKERRMTMSVILAILALITIFMIVLPILGTLLSIALPAFVVLGSLFLIPALIGAFIGIAISNKKRGGE